MVLNAREQLGAWEQDFIIDLGDLRVLVEQLAQLEVQFAGIQQVFALVLATIGERATKLLDLLSNVIVWRVVMHLAQELETMLAVLVDHVVHEHGIAFPTLKPVVPVSHPRPQEVELAVLRREPDVAFLQHPVDLAHHALDVFERPMHLVVDQRDSPLCALGAEAQRHDLRTELPRVQAAGLEVIGHEAVEVIEELVKRVPVCDDAKVEVLLLAHLAVLNDVGEVLQVML